ncbi:hypothetical protein D3C74_457260 [compost metagenome]
MLVKIILAFHDFQHFSRLTANPVPLRRKLGGCNIRALFYRSHHIRHVSVGLIELCIPAVGPADAAGAGAFGYGAHEILHFTIRLTRFPGPGNLAEAAGQLLEYL